jgi:chromosome partitioning protein
MSDTKIIVFANDKGGNGKTTCAVNLAYIAALNKYKVLLIDADAQCNATDRLNVNRLETTDKTIYEYFFNNADNKSISEYIAESCYKNLDILIGDFRFNSIDADVEICQNGPRNNKHYYIDLEKDLRNNCDYDIVFIDTHPSSTDRIKPIFEVADYILIPTDLDGQSDTGGMRLIDYVDTLRRYNAAKTQFIGFIPYRLDKRTSIYKDVIPELKKNYSVFETVIPQSESVKQSVRVHQPTIKFAPSAKVSKAFKDLFKEVAIKIG